MARFGVDVEADVHVASRQADDEVRVSVHWMTNKDSEHGNLFLQPAGGCKSYPS